MRRCNPQLDARGCGSAHGKGWAVRGPASAAVFGTRKSCLAGRQQSGVRRRLKAEIGSREAGLSVTEASDRATRPRGLDFCRILRLSTTGSCLGRDLEPRPGTDVLGLVVT